MANRGMGRGSQRRTVGGLRMDAVIAQVWAAEWAAQAPVTTQDEALARIGLICRLGRIDPDAGGQRHAYPVTMTEGGVALAGRAYVASLGGCLLIAYMIPGKYVRRLLVVPGEGGVPSCWLQRVEDAATVFPHSGKYARSAVTLIALRTHEAGKAALAA